MSTSHTTAVPPQAPDPPKLEIATYSSSSSSSSSTDDRDPTLTILPPKFQSYSSAYLLYAHLYSQSCFRRLLSNLESCFHTMPFGTQKLLSEFLDELTSSQFFNPRDIVHPSPSITKIRKADITELPPRYSCPEIHLVNGPIFITLFSNWKFNIVLYQSTSHVINIFTDFRLIFLYFHLLVFHNAVLVNIPRYDSPPKLLMKFTMFMFQLLGSPTFKRRLSFSLQLPFIPSFKEKFSPQFPYRDTPLCNLFPLVFLTEYLFNKRVFSSFLRKSILISNLRILNALKIETVTYPNPSQSILASFTLHLSPDKREAIPPHQLYSPGFATSILTKLQNLPTELYLQCLDYTLLAILSTCQCSDKRTKIFHPPYSKTILFPISYRKPSHPSSADERILTCIITYTPSTLTTSHNSMFSPDSKLPAIETISPSHFITEPAPFEIQSLITGISSRTTTPSQTLFHDRSGRHLYDPAFSCTCSFRNKSTIIDQNVDDRIATVNLSTSHS